MPTKGQAPKGLPPKDQWGKEKVRLHCHQEQVEGWEHPLDHYCHLLKAALRRLVVKEIQERS